MALHYPTRSSSATGPRTWPSWQGMRLASTWTPSLIVRTCAWRSSGAQRGMNTCAQVSRWRLSTRSRPASVDDSTPLLETSHRLSRLNRRRVLPCPPRHSPSRRQACGWSTASLRMAPGCWPSTACRHGLAGQQLCPGRGRRGSQRCSPLRPDSGARFSSGWACDYGAGAQRGQDPETPTTSHSTLTAQLARDDSRPDSALGGGQSEKTARDYPDRCAGVSSRSGVP